MNPLRTNIGNVSTLDGAVAAFNPTERRRERRSSAFIREDSGIAAEHRCANQKQDGRRSRESGGLDSRWWVPEQAFFIYAPPAHGPQLIARRCVRDSAHLLDSTFLLQLLWTKDGGPFH